MPARHRANKKTMETTYRVYRFLSLLLESLTISEEEDADELDGLPDDFDGWVYGIVCSMIVQMDDDDNPESLWRPILDLGVFAHEWVERFFWHWFIEGVNTSSSAEVFASSSTLKAYVLQKTDCRQDH